jgi:hypothetical protein
LRKKSTLTILPSIHSPDHNTAIMSPIIRYLLLLCLALPYLVSAGQPVYIGGEPTLPYPEWGNDISLDVCS